MTTTLPPSVVTALPRALLFLRWSVALVMLIWALDKFINPGHGAAVFESFYGIGGLGSTVVYVIGAIQLIIVLAFAAGAFKTISYGAVLLMHAASTLSSYAQYLDPYNGANLLFFAAWPMLAAAAAVFMLRKADTLLAVEQ